LVGWFADNSEAQHEPDYDSNADKRGDAAEDFSLVVIHASARFAPFPAPDKHQAMSQAT
jgi:hypothetical protein